jgi:hypothetical protein
MYELKELEEAINEECVGKNDGCPPGHLKEMHDSGNKIIDKVRLRPTLDKRGDIRQVQCENCIRKGLRDCMYHGYPDGTIPRSCSYKIGDAAVDTVYDVPILIHKKQQADVLDAVMGVVDQYIPFGDSPTAIMVREINEAKKKAELRQQSKKEGKRE